jgi:hypothetical protein
MMENYSQVKHIKNQLVIYNDESLSGFLFRLSQRNYYPNVSCLTNYLGLSTYQSQNNEFEQESIRKLASLNEELDYRGIYNGCNLQELVGSDLYTKIIMKNRVKYCPICIQDKFYHRTIWGIIPFHLCIEHRVILVDQCPHCGHLISMASFINQKCDRCFFDYNEAEPSKIEDGNFIESQIQLNRGFWNEKINVIQNCNFTEFMKLAFHSFHLLIGATDYTSLTTGILTLFYNRSNGEKSGLELANALSNVYWIFKDFPNHFIIVLINFLSRNIGRARYNRLKEFEKIFNDQTFSWVQEAYNSFFIDQIDKGNVRKDFSIFKKNPELLLKRTKIRREEVRQNTGITYEKLHELNDFHELRIETNITNGQSRYLIEKNTLENYLSNKLALISRKEVGLILGINSYSVIKVVDAGYLIPIQVANSPIIKFQIQEVKKLIESCQGQIVTKLKTSLIRFHDVLSKYSTCSITIVHIIAFTLSGHLKPVRTNLMGNLADNYYEDNELKTCLELIKNKRQEEVGFFFQDVMKKLKIGEKRLWKIINEQGIVADFTLHMKDGRKRYYFKEDTISKIQQCISSSYQ